MTQNQMPDSETKRQFDKHYLSKLFSFAMGNRKQKEFADLIGITKETVSRIINENYNSPLRKETLKKIAKHSERRVRLGELMVACGYKDSCEPVEIREWREINIRTIRDFVDEYLNRYPQIVDPELKEVYDLLFSEDDDPSFAYSEVKDCVSEDFSVCDSYCMLTVTWSNEKLDATLTAYVMLLGYVKRDGRFCSIKATTSPEKIAKIDIDMRHVFDNENKRLIESGSDGNVYDEEIFSV